MINKSKVLVFDIETAPMTAYVWGLKDQNIGLNQIKSDWHVLAWAAKWLDTPASKVMYMDQRKAKNIEDDKAILEGIWMLLNEADIVITQFGTGFDSPKLNARFIMQGMKPPKPYKHLDTYRIVKSVAQFTSNKLEYLTDKLCTKYKKLSHKKYPGMELWKECMKGNIEAWDEMKKYNIHDVLSTEEFYNKIRAWAPSTAPKVFEDQGVCNVCGNKALQKRGFIKTLVTTWQRLQCQQCGRWQKGEKA